MFVQQFLEPKLSRRHYGNVSSLCTIAQSPGVYKTESVSTMGHARSLAVISIPLGLDRMMSNMHLNGVHVLGGTTIARGAAPRPRVSAREYPRPVGTRL